MSMNTEPRAMLDPTAAAEASADRPFPDPERWVEDHGDYLFGFALSRLRDVSKAEDLVQDTFWAALKGAAAFQGRSAEKSWLVGILKNKICDHYRKLSRETTFTDMEFYSDEESERFIPEGQFKDGWIHELGPQEMVKSGRQSRQRRVLADLSRLL
jgi:RNA polymerase sigma factor (sigma-70 family)